MAADGIKKIGSHLQMATGKKIKNLDAAQISGEAIEFGQFNAAMSLKQDTLSSSNSITMDGNTPRLNISNDAFRGGLEFTETYSVDAYLSGSYVKAEISGSVSGTNKVFSSSSNHAVYYRPATDGTLHIICFYTGNNLWYAYDTPLTSITELAHGVEIIPGSETYSEGDGNNTSITGTSETINDTIYPVDNSQITWTGGTGLDPMLEVTSSGVRVKTVADVTSASSANVMTGLATKNALEDLENQLSSASGITVSGGGSLQSDLDDLHAKDASQDSTIAAATVKGNNNENAITNVRSVLEVSAGAGTLGAFTNPILLDDVTVKAQFEHLADAMVARGDAADALLGIDLDTGSFVMDSPIYSDGESVKVMLEEVAAVTEQLQQGMGSFWDGGVDYHHHVDANDLPATWYDGATDVANAIIDPSGSNIAVSAMPAGTSILMVTDGGSVEDGLYITVDAGGGVFYFTRDPRADESSEFIPSKTVQIDKGGSHAKAVYTYTGVADPVLGTDTIVFGLQRTSGVGDNTIGRTQLDDETVEDIDEKALLDTAPLSGLALTADTPLVVSHSFARGNYIAQVSHAAASSNTDGELFTDEVILGNNQITLQTGETGVVVDVVILGVA